jgi:anti-sigma factor RsiW
MSCRDSEPLLNPYLDGELPLTEVLGVERHLAECPVCRTQYEALEKLRMEIAAAGLDYVPPAHLEAALEKARPRAPKARGFRWLGAGAAAAAVLVLALAIPRAGNPPDSAVQEVLDGHLRSLLAAHLVDVPSSDRHTVKPWFQGKIGFSPDVPDLSQDGFALVGGRLDVIQQHRAVALVYKRRDHVINLFIAEGQTASADRTAEEQGYHLISWVEGGLAYWAISDLNMGELTEFSALIRHK